MGDKRPDWRRRQSEMGIRFNPMRGAESRPIPGEIVARQQRKPKNRAERDASGGSKLHMRPAEVYDLDPEDRFNWLQSALLLAGRGDIKADNLYDIIASSKFASGVGSGVGGQMKASLLANLHLFKKEQQRAIKSDIIHLLTTEDAVEVGKSGDTKENGTPTKVIKPQSEDDDKSSEKSQSRKHGHRKSSRKSRSSGRSCSRSRRRSQSRSCSHSRSRSASQRKSSRKRSRKASRRQSSERSRKKAPKDDHKGRKRKRSASSSAVAESPPRPAEKSSPAQVKEMGVDVIAGAYKEMVQIAQEEEEEAQRLKALEQQAAERKQKEEELRRTLMELAAVGDEEVAEEGADEEKEKAKKKKEKKARKSKKADK
mmetsp:Transcript_79794/g.151550  ORF Transcript_79794/g.151550 Transcript_79794/m.151550 type:complete len:370 (-) Transcript_79794:69-1178(-)